MLAVPHPAEEEVDAVARELRDKKFMLLIKTSLSDDSLPLAYYNSRSGGQNPLSATNTRPLSTRWCTA